MDIKTLTGLVVVCIYVYVWVPHVIWLKLRSRLAQRVFSMMVWDTSCNYRILEPEEKKKRVYIELTYFESFQPLSATRIRTKCLSHSLRRRPQQTGDQLRNTKTQLQQNLYTITFGKHAMTI